MRRWEALKRFCGIDRISAQQVAGADMVIVVPLVNFVWWRQQERVRVFGRWWWVESLEVIEDSAQRNWCEVSLSLDKPEPIPFVGELRPPL